MYKEKQITVHTICKNEPFIYYAIKAVYPYVNKILLYDTGSDDKYTLKDIQDLLNEDVDNKITFKETKIEVDETIRDYTNIKEIQAKTKGKFHKGKVRQQQIDDTDTEFFMIVDGDEVHYKNAMVEILKVIENWDNKNACAQVPLLWYTELNKIYRKGFMGRVFKTEYLKMNDISPGEMHVDKRTEKVLEIGDGATIVLNSIMPCAHYQSYLKPWRKNGWNASSVHVNIPLPEIILENPKYKDRFENER